MMGCLAWQLKLRQPSRFPTVRLLFQVCRGKEGLPFFPLLRPNKISSLARSKGGGREKGSLITPGRHGILPRKSEAQLARLAVRAE
jgi:hypothetical protein